MNARPWTILVLGASGQVGWELLRALAPLGRVIGAAVPPWNGLLMDLAQPGNLEHLLASIHPDVVVNAAAYTAVDRAELEPELAMRINGAALSELGFWAAKAGIPVLHYSTDFVFPGDANQPYLEDAATGPLNVYGVSKLAGELALAASGAPWLILRTSWVYGVRGNNFLLTLQRLLKERAEVRVVDDQIGAPTWSRLLAEVTAQIIGHIRHGGLDIATVQGVYHVSGGGSTSWHGFARAILDYERSPCRLLAIPTADYPTPARRPAYSVLDNGKLQRTFGLALPHWRESLGHCLEDLGQYSA